MALAEEKRTADSEGHIAAQSERSRGVGAPGPELEASRQQAGGRLSFKDFGETMQFVNRVAQVAQEEDHHPDIEISYNKVHLTLSTHSIGGLSRNDFIVAAKIERLL